jgi:ABC transporter substrate binding protein
VNRREFIMLIGGAAAWPAAARAQQTGKVPTIGLLGSGTAAAQSQWTAAFVTRLREIGWTERRNIAIEYRWAEGRSERFVEIAEEFVRLKVDVIVTHNTLPALAAKQATSAIPIVFATAGDPLGTGIVASLARPGGNITGFEPAPRCHRQAARTPASDRDGKRLDRHGFRRKPRKSARRREKRDSEADRRAAQHWGRARTVHAAMRTACTSAATCGAPICRRRREDLPMSWHRVN